MKIYLAGALAARKKGGFAFKAIRVDLFFKI
jgi:hypothetical protein